MKVWSLIDNPDAEERSSTTLTAKNRHESGRQYENQTSSASSYKSHQPPLTSDKTMRNCYDETGSEKEPNPRICDGKCRSESSVVPESVAVSLLGPGVKGTVMKSSVFEAALCLRSEQEKTEQERLKLELASKTKAILEYAVENNIPMDSLLLLRPDHYSSDRNVKLSSPVPKVQVPYTDLNRSAGFSEDSNGSKRQATPAMPSSLLPRKYENSNNASSVDPINFKFGGPANFSNTSPQRRPRSPAKLGAIAVANLANPLTPYRPSVRTIPHHQRHYSMPVESLASAPIEHSQAKRKGDQAFQTTNLLRSPVGGTSSMQVRPLSAQPLHKQRRNGSLSQDTISQHQQVIQFHHWISENPGEKSVEKFEHRRNDSATSQLSASHKRRKSADIPIGHQ